MYEYCMYFQIRVRLFISFYMDVDQNYYPHILNTLKSFISFPNFLIVFHLYSEVTLVTFYNITTPHLIEFVKNTMSKRTSHAVRRLAHIKVFNQFCINDTKKRSS